MVRADLTKGIRQGMMRRETKEPPAVPVPAEAVGDVPRRSLRGRLLGRLADYARRYLTSSVEHRLTLALAELGAIRQQLALDLDQAAHERAEIRARLDGFSGVVEDAAAQRLHFARLQVALDGLPALFGPRLDELEIKARPLIAFDDASYAIRLADGYAMVPRDQPVFAVMVANATSGGLEPGTRRVLQSLLDPGMGVADVGANVGLLTLACAVKVGPHGKVFAFEPEPGPRAQLAKTLHLNGLSWVEVFDCAIGAAQAEAVFHISPVIGHSSLYRLPDEEHGRGRDIEVAVQRLDDVVSPSQRLDVVKIDVEGAELDVLAGMSRLLTENHDLAVIAEFGPSHLARVGIAPTAWFKAFAAHGLEPFEISEPDGACRSVGPEHLTTVVSANIVFVRPGGQAIARLPR